MEPRIWLTEALGWLSSLVLLATVIAQVRKQSAQGGARVSGWLYIGQTIASFGFMVYSLLVENWVFMVTNAMLTVVALRGWILQKREAEQG